jgi:hypothetical protein
MVKGGKVGNVIKKYQRTILVFRPLGMLME